MKTNSRNTITVLSTWTQLLGVPLCVGLMLALMVPDVTFSQYANPDPVPLLTAGTYGALSYGGITGTANVNGDVGSSNSTVDPGITATGTNWTTVNNAHNLQAQTDLGLALSYASSQANNATIAANALGGQVLHRGVYGGGALDLAGGATLELNGGPSDVFIIKASSSLTINIGSTVSLTGGAVWSNVFWYVGSSATIFSGSTFNGILLAVESITLNSGAAHVTGQLLANTGAVGISSNVLPVELASFTATANRLNAELRWSTATEVNNYGFDVERRLVNSQSSTLNTWMKIGFVKGSGTSNSAHSYSYTDASVSSGTYAYRLKQIDNSGTYKYSSAAEVTVSVPKVFALNQNYPNPFNPTTTIQFTLGNDGMATLQVYNILGQKVATLFNGNAEAGRMYQVTLDASKLTSGLYIAKLESGNQRMMQKMVLMK